MSPRYRHKRDHSHDAIAEAFEAAGWLVKSMTQLDEWVDMAVLSPRKRLFMVECKTGAGKLRPSQEKLIADGWPVIVLRDPDETLDFIRTENKTP